MAITPPPHLLHSPYHLKRLPAESSSFTTSSSNSIKMKKSSDSLNPPSPRPEAAARSSFCSVRESDSDLAQTFTKSKVSSYSSTQYHHPHGPRHNEAIDDDSASSNGDMSEVQFHPPLTHPHSRLHGYFYPADSFRGWKQISVRGKAASRSYGDLQVLNLQWKSPATQTRERKKYAPGNSPFERLPYEILRSIVDLLVVDIPTHGVTARNVDLMSLLLTSRTMHAATLNTLYNHVTIPHSRIFRKFLTHIQKNPSLGTIVRRMDFCHFNPSTIFSTAKERASAVNLTADTLVECLELTPYLQEFLAQEYLDDDLDLRVLKKLFFGLPRLQAVDFCGCTSRKFKEAFQSILLERWPSALPIKRFSMHKCISLPPTVYEMITPRLVQLTHLDVANTQMTDAALLSVPVTARLTHLNLAKCNRLSAGAVIEFIANHPAARSLVFLSLGMDARSNQLLDFDDLTELIPHLPSTLKSLTLKGSKMNSSHMSLLRPLTAHLEELALGRCLNIQDIDILFAPEEPSSGEMEVGRAPLSLRYLDVSDLAPADIDYSYLFGRKSAILKKESIPLSVIEVSDIVLERLKKSSVVVERAGWTPKEFQSRSWVVRHDSELSEPRDDGRRSWKWGASFWGMRKIPVALMDVGGMYGSYMFGRKL